MRKVIIIECRGGVIEGVYANRNDFQLEIFDWDEFNDPEIQKDTNKISDMKSSYAKMKVLKKIY